MDRSHIDRGHTVSARAATGLGAEGCGFPANRQPFAERNIPAAIGNRIDHAQMAAHQAVLVGNMPGLHTRRGFLNQQQACRPALLESALEPRHCIGL